MAYDMTREEIGMYEKLYNLSGARIRFNCDKVTYQGIVGQFNLPQHKFTLRHASIVDGEYMDTLRFRYEEVKNLTVVESRKVVERYPRNEYLLSILRNPRAKQHNVAKILYNISDDSDDESTVSDDKPKEKFVLDFPYYLKSKLPNEFVLLDSLDSSFHQVIQDISKEKVIGVSFEGALMSRFGKISLISIATKTHVYVFDIESLTAAAFRYGLRDIFEDTSLLKVIHDCRFAADCLSYTYQVELENVFDTQIADFVVALQVYNDKYKYKFVNNVDGCMRHHLDLPPEYTHKRVKGLSADERKELFTKRPMSNEFMYDVTKNALYLLLLHKTLSKKLLGPLKRNSIAYRNLISKEANSVVDFLGTDLSSPECMPESLLMIGIQTVKFRMPRVLKELPPLIVNYIHPKTGRIVVIKDDENTSVETTKHFKESCINKNSAAKKFKSLSENTINIRSNELENNSVDCESISFVPSSRHMDEVFHKLANNRNSHSYNAYNINVTPDYASKFTMRQPFTGYKNHTTSENEVSNAIAPSDLWAKIRAECDVPRALVPGREKRKILFVPA